MNISEEHSPFRLFGFTILQIIFELSANGSETAESQSTTTTGQPPTNENDDHMRRLHKQKKSDGMDFI